MFAFPHLDASPRLGKRVFVASTATVVGDVKAGDDTSFWFGVVARGDVHRITIGKGTNIQDGAILHVTYERHPLLIGDGVVVGHSAMLHGCTIEDGALIGIGARVLDGAVVEGGAQIAAGAVVAPGHRIPAGCLAMGIPARPSRALRADEKAYIEEIRDRYIALKDRYIEMMGMMEMTEGEG